MGELPPAWIKCPRKGEIVEGKFLPFKTPLDQRFMNRLRPEDLFTPEMVIGSMKSIKVKIGLWVDLTNTERYYNKEIVEKNGVNYFKMRTQGHKQAPTVEETSLFVNICHNFILKNPLSIIAVHCTHGFNRTGFLICAYLIEKQDWSPDAALCTYAACRPPGIYKHDYIKELFRRYGDMDDVPPIAPMRPLWRLEESNHYNQDDDGNQLEEEEEEEQYDDRPQSSNGTRSAKRKASTQFMEGISGVEFVSDVEKSTRLQKKVQELCHFDLRGFPGAQPVSMSHENLCYLQREPYKVSWKADGTRYMMLIEGENQIYLFDRDFSVFEIVENCPKFPKRKEPNKHICEALLDGEMVIDVVDDVKYPRYLIYDIIKIEKDDVGQMDFNIRSLCIQKEIIFTRDAAKKEGRIDRNLELFGIRKKDFWDIETTEKILSPKFAQGMTHEVDGLIFQPIKCPYQAGQCPKILKWKPETHNSVDFKVRIIRTLEPGCLPETFASLQVGRENKEIGRIKATKEFRENDNKIVECTWDYSNRTWKFMRVRTDKSFPNSYNTAASVWETIQKPLTAEHLISFISEHRYMPRGQKRPYS